METDPADEIENPSLLERIRRRNRRVGRQLYRQWRTSLTISGPLFILVGALDLAGLAHAANNRSNVSGVVLIMLGAAMATARLTWFRARPRNGSAAQQGAAD